MPQSFADALADALGDQPKPSSTSQLSFEDALKDALKPEPRAAAISTEPSADEQAAADRALEGMQGYPIRQPGPIPKPDAGDFTDTLRGNEGRLASARTGGRVLERPRGAEIFDGTISGGVKRVGAGIEKVFGQPQVLPAEGHVMRQSEPGRDKAVMTGVSDIINGTFQAATPLMVGAAVANPVGVVWGVLKAEIAKQVGADAAEAVGASPEAAQLVGDIAMALSGAKSADDVLKGNVDSFGRRLGEVARAKAQEFKARRQAEAVIAEPVPVASGATPAAAEAKPKLEAVNHEPPISSTQPVEPMAPAPRAQAAPRVPVEQVWKDYDAAAERGDLPAVKTAEAELRRQGVTSEELAERAPKEPTPEGRLSMLESVQNGKAVPFQVDRDDAAISPYYRAAKDQPGKETTVAVEHIVATQPSVDPAIVRNYLRAERPTKLPDAVQIGDQFYLVDGHHAAVAQWAKGAQSIALNVKQADPALLERLQQPAPSTGVVKPEAPRLSRLDEIAAEHGKEAALRQARKWRDDLEVHPSSHPDHPDYRQFTDELYDPLDRWIVEAERTPRADVSFGEALAEVKAEAPRKHASTQVPLPSAQADKLKLMASRVAAEDLYPQGREENPHVTVQYGLKNEDVEKVRSLLADQPPVTVTFGKTSIFPDTGNGEVVKVDVDSPDLHRLKQSIKDVTGASDGFPDYKPHATIAYVKPGEGQKYADRDDMAGETAEISELVFSTPDDEQITIPLGGKKQDDEKLRGELKTAKANADALKTAIGKKGGDVAWRRKNLADVEARIADIEKKLVPAEKVSAPAPKSAPEKKPVTPQIDAPTAYTIPTFITAQHSQPKPKQAEQPRSPQQTYKAFQREFTKALRSGDPHKIIAEAHRFEQHYENSSDPYPDDWSKWQRAKEDAQFKLKMAEPVEIGKPLAPKPVEETDEERIARLGRVASLKQAFGNELNDEDRAAIAAAQAQITGGNDAVQEPSPASVDARERASDGEAALAEDDGEDYDVPEPPEFPELEPIRAKIEAGAELTDEEEALLGEYMTAGKIDARYKPGTFGPAIDFDADMMDPAKVFPAVKKTVKAKTLAGAELLTQDEANARIAEWKAEAKRIGKEEDHRGEVIYSLFDHSGAWSQPWRDAGYSVRKYDIKNGDDLMEFMPIGDIQEDKAAGMKVVGVIAAPPCTSFAVSGARWWEDQHDKADTEMVEKKYGYRASKYFDTPLEYANYLVKAVEAFVGFANPSRFHAMENPVGRIAEQNELPKPLLAFDPSNFGNPYTKKTFLWGTFNPNLPTANVEPTQGSLMHKLRGDKPEEKALRSLTPEGFAYAFFMANRADVVTKEGPNVGDDDTRQLPVAAGDTADSDRAGSGEASPAVAAQDGQRAGQATGRAAAGDAEAVVEERAGSAAADGEVADGVETASGGDHPVRTAVSPTGAEHDPGPIPLDFELTPERVDAIVNRGAVQRAKDNLAAILTVRSLQESKRWPTHDEQETLSRYVGWGDSDVAQYLGLSPRYNWSKPEKTLWEELKSLGEDTLKGLRGSTTNAHFTFDIYRPIWEALTRAGFGGGRVLEPASGVGHAIGLMPATTRANSTVTGVELEPLTAAIAGFLYPSATIQATGYQNALIARDTIDLAISNVPFAQGGVYDPTMDPSVTKPIHNYFFAKALTHLRPGGLLVFLTSRYTLDGPTHTAFRQYIADRADFLGAVRLPTEAFDKTAKTEVVTDIIVLRKREEGAPEAETNKLFITVDEPRALQPGSDYRGRPLGGAVYRSQWYTEHPELVVGKEDKSGTMYQRGGYNVTLEKPETLQARIAEALGQVLPEGTYRKASRPVREKQVVERGTAKVGEMRVDGKKIVVVSADGTLEDATPTRQGKVDAKAFERVKGMIGIRDARRELVKLMRSEEATDAGISKAQKALGKAYDSFVKEYGHLNTRTNKMLFAGDPEVAAILALEVVETKAVSGTDKQGRPTLNVTTVVTGKADIFSKRTMRPVSRVTTAGTPKEAMLASLGSYAGLDWPYMARISGTSAKDLQKDLIDEGLIYEEPNGAFTLAEEYLSGDVVTKLEDAQAAGKKFDRNVAALEPLQPKLKTREDIESGVVSIALGSGWVEPETFADFAATQLGGNAITLTRTTTTALVKWSYNSNYQADSAADRHPLAVEYSGKRYSFIDLLMDTLNLQAPTLGVYVEGATRGSKVFIKDEKATLAARANQDSVRDLWLQYLFERPDLQDRLLDVFNKRFNRTVERTFDGSHLTFEGMTDTVKLLPHQRNAVWRILTTGNTLLAHEVGAGKTFEMIAASQEMKRTGRASKPAIVVPTYLIGQWRRDIMKLYPDAKLLAFEEGDLAADKRQLAMARIANGTWDVVLIPHSSFGLLSVDPARMQSMYDRWISELEAAIEGADQMSVKQLERVRNGLKDKVTKLRQKVEDRAKDNALTWEELGIDALYIDEAHAFKNLFYFSEIENIRGLSRSSSDRSIDLFIKVQEINEQSRYRNLVLATATPMMNSMAEVYTMQRYLQPQVLQQNGISQFDLWYAMFAKALPSTEQQPDGTYKEVMRLRDFRNLQLLSKMVRQVMDYVGWEDMPYLNLPKVEGGKVEIVQTEPHPMYAQAQRWFSTRMENLRDLPPKVDKRKLEYVAPMRFHPITGEAMEKPDNILTVMTDAKKAAVDLRLVFGDYAKDWKGSRVQSLADRVGKIYKAGHKGKLTQLIFLDLGTPKDLQPLEFLQDTVVSGDDEPEEDKLDDSDEGTATVPDDDESEFNLYEAVKREIMRRGIPSNEIAFIHQAQTNAERNALFEAMNEGKVRVLMASTDKGGVGMNVQTRLAAIHEMDAPRAGRPGDLRQRMGRGIRQGNTNKTVRLIRYVTKGTTDEWLWGVMVNKDAQIQQFMRGKATHLLEEDPSTMSLQEAQIRSSGDPRGVELVELKSKNARLSAQASSAQNAIALAKSDIVRMAERVRHYTRDLNDLNAWVERAWKSQRGDAFSMKVGRETFTKRDDANTAVIAAVRRLVEEDEMIDRAIGEIGGLPIVAQLRRATTVGKKNEIVRYTVADLRLNERALGGNEGGSMYTIEHRDGDDTKDIGKGTNPATSIVNAYERIPERAAGLRSRIADAEEKKAASEATASTPSPAIAEHARVVARIAELEKELKLEGSDEELDEEGKPKSKPKRAVPEFRKPLKSKTEAKKKAEPKVSGMPSYANTLPKRPTPTKDVVALPVDEIVKKLSLLFDKVPVSVGHFREHFRAIYKIDPASVKSKEANDLYAIAHEFGHHIDHKLMNGSALNKRGPIATELETLGAATSKPSYSKKQQRQEGAAEFFRIWLLEPERLLVEAPMYLAEFDRFLAMEAEIGEGLEEIRDYVQMYLSLDGYEQAKLSIDFGKDSSLLSYVSRLYEQATDDDARRDALATLSTHLVDDLAWIGRAEKALVDGAPLDITDSSYALARLARGAAAKAEGFLRFGVRNNEGQIQSTSLDAAIRPIIKDLAAFQVYLKARHAVDMEAAGKVSGMSYGQIAEAMAKETPEFKAAAGKVDEFQRAMRRYMVEQGIWSIEQVRAMEKAWPHYVPMTRVMEEAGGGTAGGGKKLANRGKGIKVLKGSGRRTYPALTNIIQNAHEMVNNAEMNKAMLALVRQVTSTPDSARWMEEIPTPQVATRVNLEAFKDDIEAQLQAQGVAMPSNLNLDVLVTAWTPRQYATNDGRFVTVVDNGQLRWFEVHEKGLYDSITAIGPQATKEAYWLFSLGSQSLRKFATTTLGFVLSRNPPRDIATAMVYSRSGFRPTDFLRGLFSALKKDEDYQLFVNSGAGQSAQVAPDRDLIKQRLAAMDKSRMRQWLDYTVLGPIDGLQALSQLLEESTRIGEFKRTLGKLGQNESGLLQAGLNARDVTQDFSKLGKQIRSWNRIVAFFGARVGGYTRLAQAMREGGGGGKIPPKTPGGRATGGATGGFPGAPSDAPGPMGFLLKAITAISLLSVALWVLHHDDEDYYDLPEWERQSYWHLGRGGNYVRISKPFELGTLFGTTVESALDWMYGRDKSIVDSLPSKGVANDIVLAVTPTTWLPFIQIAANYDFFKGRAIVSPFDADLEPELQYNRWTSETAKKLGKALGMSPAKLESLIYGYTAGVGRGVMQATDMVPGMGGWVRPSGGLEQVPGLGSFYRGKAQGDAQPISDLYELRDRIAGLDKSVKRLLEQDRKADADALKAANKDVLSRRKAVSSAVGAMKGIRNDINDVFDNQTMTPAAKREALDKLYDRMKLVARRATR